MKHLTKLPLVVAALATLATTAARADDQRLQDRLAADRNQTQLRETTVAVYADRQGAGQCAAGQCASAQCAPAETRYEWRMRNNGTGGYGAYVQASTSN